MWCVGVKVAGDNGRDAKLRTENAAGRFDAVGHRAKVPRAAAHGQDFEAVVGIQVNVERGKNEFARIVLQARKAFLKPPRVMVVEKHQRPGGAGRVAQRGIIDGRPAQQIRRERGPAGRAFPADERIEVAGHGGGNGKGNPHAGAFGRTFFGITFFHFRNTMELTPGRQAHRVSAIMTAESYFDQLAARTDALAFRPEEREGVARLLRRLAPLEGARVVEAGCGNGRLSVKLAEAIGAAGRLWALDPSAEMGACCRRALATAGAGEWTTVEIAAAETSAAPESAWDCALFFRAWPHVGNPVRVLEQSRRWLAEGGRLVIANLQGSAQLNAMHAACHRAVEGHRMPPAVELARTLTEAGWRVETAVETPEDYFISARPL